MKKQGARIFLRWVSFALITLILLTLAGCGSGDGDKDKAENKVYRIGLLSGSDTFNTAMDGFKAQMTEDGYIEGQNVIYDFQAAGADPVKMAQISQKFVSDNVDLIFLTTNNAALAARAATKGTDIPVVFSFVIAPARTGVVDDLAQPGGNLTGVMNPLDLFIGKRIEFLMKIDPTVQRIWLPYDPSYPTSTIIYEELARVAPILGIELVETHIFRPFDVVVRLDGYEQTDEPPFDAIIIFPELTVQQPESWNAILAYANEHKLPILANAPPQVEAGALLGYFSDNVATGRHAARLAEQILQGEDPGKLPIETDEQYLTINLKAGEALGLTIGDDILRQATTVIR